MEIITSAQNPKIKMLTELQEKSKTRKKEGLFVVEGVRELLHCVSVGYQVHTLFVCMDILTEDCLAEIENAVTGKYGCFSIPRHIYEKVA